MSTIASDFSTPETAIESLEAAYMGRNIDAAVAAKDFEEEARLMLKRINPELMNDPEVLKQTVEVLELTFRKQIRDEGFPDFSSVKCTLASPVEISEVLVRVHETCLFPDGGKSEQNIQVFRGALGWRVVNVPS